MRKIKTKVMIKKFLLYSLIATLIISLSTCKSGKSGSDELDDVADSLISMDVDKEFSEEVIDNIVQNISSPVETAALMKDLGVAYSNKYLAPTDRVDELNTNFKQALNLGIYGADLGYLNMYNKTNTVIDYISAIKILADEIRVGQFFDFTTLKRLATNSKNLDSLMYESLHSFNQIDRYLRANSRSNLSALIITGVWIEGLYLATQVADEMPHPQLAERIGEQKIIINKLILVLEHYESDPQFAQLLKELKLLKEEYEDVTITIEPGDPEIIEKDGMLTIIQNDVSIVNISEERLESIIQKTKEIRNRLISI